MLQLIDWIVPLGVFMVYDPKLSPKLIIPYCSSDIANVYTAVFISQS